jgi:predicted ATPase
MIESIHFKNFKALRNTTLPLSPFTLIVGPNGSGKSTAMQALKVARSPGPYEFDTIVTAGLRNQIEAAVEITINWDVSLTKVISKSGWEFSGNRRRVYGPDFLDTAGEEVPNVAPILRDKLSGFRIFSFDALQLSSSVELRAGIQLETDGSNLAGVLDHLRDNEPERFESLNEELGRWLPEFDRILFETPRTGHRAFLLRTRSSKSRIQAYDLSHGTLYALAFLTLAYLPNPPSIVCFEEPERGIHPRLLREIRDAMYRLCYPEGYGDKRSPVQVIATTHSPYLLDLYKDHPEEVVIAHKDEQGVQFERLSEKPDINEFLQDAPLGEVWYSGILGGVPMKP